MQIIALYISVDSELNVELISPQTPQDPTALLEGDTALAISVALKHSPGAGRERVVDPDNLVPPACAPEAYGGPTAGETRGSNPITGEAHRNGFSV